MLKLPTPQPPVLDSRLRGNDGARGYRWRRLALLLASLSFLFCGVLVWLATTESGLNAALRLGVFLSGYRLNTQGATGRLIGPFALERLEWSSAHRIRLTELWVDWSPARLLSGKLEVDAIQLTRLDLALEPHSPPTATPTRLTLPFALEISQLELGSLFLSDAPTPLLTNLTARISSDGQTHQLSRLRLSASGFLLNASGALQGNDPPNLAVRAELQGSLAEHDALLTVQTEGPLTRLPVQGTLSGAGSSGSFSLTLTPFATQKIEALQAKLEGINPSLWHKDAPKADLVLEIHFPSLADQTLSGPFELINRQPARLDQNGLPLERLQGQFRSAGQHYLELLQLEAAFPGQGRAHQGRLTLTRLPEAEHLTAEGDFVHLNPARLAASWPDGEINGAFTLQTRSPPNAGFQGVEDVDMSFHLEPSRLARQRLRGRGQIEWSRAPEETGTERLKVNVDATAGTNRLTLKGTLGDPQDVLQANIAAPTLETLALPGLSGDLAANLQFSGPLRAPAVQGELKSKRLTLFDQTHLTGLALTMRLGGLTPDSVAQATLQLDRLEHAGQRLEQVKLQLEGSSSQHTLRVTAQPTLPEIGRAHLEFDARGSLGQTPQDWEGFLHTLTLNVPKQAPLLELTNPVLLRLSENSFTLGAATLHGDLHGTQGGKWQAKIDTLKREGDAWSGQMEAQTSDLGWIAPLLGEGYQTGGQMKTRLSFAALTPAWLEWALGTGPQPATTPRLEGHLTGSNLLFRALAPGLRLESGQLALRLDAQRLTLDTFRFDAPHGPLPKTPERDWQESLQPLSATPGRAEGQGHLALGPDASGQLEFRLQNLGIPQNPEQWIILSGQGAVRRTATETRFEANLRVDGGYWQFAELDTPQRSADVRVVRRSDEHTGNSGGGKSTATPLTARIAIDLGPHFYFAGAGVRSRLRGDLNLEGRPREPLRATGSIRTAGGHFDAYGQQLDIEQGILSFNGLVSNPALNVRAMRREQAVAAGVAITGTAQKPIIQLISDPEVPDVEKLSWLVLGEAPDQNMEQDTATLLAAANALLGGQESGPGNVLTQLQRQLGVQVKFGRGQVGQDNSPNRTSRVADTGGFGTAPENTASDQILRVGMRLAKGLTLSYEQSMNSVESVVKLNYALSRRLSITGQTGSDNALDLFWNYRFGRARPPDNAPNASPPEP